MSEVAMAAWTVAFLCAVIFGPVIIAVCLFSK
jgi:hypothetical protein